MLDSINFNAVVRPIFDQNGNEIAPEIGRGVYRDDNDHLMSICGSAFQPVQHVDVIDPMLQTLKDQGYEIIEREGDRRDLYDLKGHRGAFVKVTTQNDGAIMRADVITGDFVQPTGRQSYMDQGPDTMLRRYTALNSHDSTYAVKTTNGYMRLICMNGMMNPLFVASSYGKHTTNFNPASLREQIIMGAKLMENDGETFGKYATTKLSLSQAEEFLKRTLAKLPNKPNGEPHYSEPKVQTILRKFHGEDQTVWGLVNAMTAWATHDDMKGKAGEITGRVNRDGQVGSAMRSHDFADLIAA
jgi:hypothetical protein